MTVFSKKATIKIEDSKHPTRELNVYLSDEKFKGIDAIILKNKLFQNELDIELVCSDINPSFPRYAQDIDELLANFKLKGSQLQHHPNDPLNSNNHLLEINTNLDNPNIDDKLRSKAKNIVEETVDKARIKSINSDFEGFNKKLSETSTANSDKLKPIDEKTTKFQIGQIERE
jgi:hypothetical protein